MYICNVVLVSGSRILGNRSVLVTFNRVWCSSLLAIHLDMRSTDRDEMANRSIWPSEQRELQAQTSSSHHSQGSRRNRHACRWCGDCKRTRTKPEACRCRGGGNDRTDGNMVESSLSSLWNRRRRSNTARRVTYPRGSRCRVRSLLEGSLEGGRDARAAQPGVAGSGRRRSSDGAHRHLSACSEATQARQRLGHGPRMAALGAARPHPGVHELAGVVAHRHQRVIVQRLGVAIGGASCSLRSLVRSGHGQLDRNM